MPWRVLSNANGSQAYNSCQGCAAALGCASDADCGPTTADRAAGCYACPAGSYFKRLQVRSVGTRTAYVGCASCAADFGCGGACTADGCTCPAGQYWAVPQGGAYRDGACAACPAAASGCGSCAQSACKASCSGGCTLSPATAQWGLCPDVVPGCKVCSRKGSCMVCAFGFFPAADRTVRVAPCLPRAFQALRRDAHVPRPEQQA